MLGAKIMIAYHMTRNC